MHVTQKRLRGSCLAAVLGFNAIFQPHGVQSQTIIQQPIPSTVQGNTVVLNPQTPYATSTLSATLPAGVPATSTLPGTPIPYSTIQNVTPGGQTFNIGGTSPWGLPGSLTQSGLPGQPSSPGPYSLPGVAPQSPPGTPQLTPTYPAAPPKPLPYINLNTPTLTPALPPVGSLYTFPGVVGVKRGRWVGSDYLYNLPDSIQIIVEIVFPEGKYIPLQQQAVENRIMRIFEEFNISPYPALCPSNLQFGLTATSNMAPPPTPYPNSSYPSPIASGPSAYSPTMPYPPQTGVPCAGGFAGAPGMPPLPFFHILIMPFPFENRYVASCSARLFEAVKLDRIDFKMSGIIQAITWEKQTLVSAGKEEFEDVVDNAIDELARAFAERVVFYREIQADLLERRRFYY